MKSLISNTNSSIFFHFFVRYFILFIFTFSISVAQEIEKKETAKEIKISIQASVDGIVKFNGSSKILATISQEIDTKGDEFGSLFLNGPLGIPTESMQNKLWMDNNGTLRFGDHDVGFGFIRNNLDNYRIQFKNPTNDYLTLGATSTLLNNTNVLTVLGQFTTNGFKMDSLASAGKVLTSDANGVGTWQTVSAGGGATQLNDLSDATYNGTSLFIGNGTGTNGINNVALGKNSLNINSTGSGNLGAGTESLKLNTTGTNNTGLGYRALFSNSNGSSNTSIGQGSLFDNTSGSDNVAIGRLSLSNSTTGSYNVSLGSLAGNNVNGSRNTFLGFQSGAGSFQHTKFGNVFIGHKAGFYETGNNKLYIQNDSSTTPLIWGDFANNILSFNGKIGIEISLPTAGLHLVDDDGALFEGTYGIGSIPVEGIGTRLMWFPKKAAFRAGGLGTSPNAWDEANIGDYSVAMGKNTTASGTTSIAVGSDTEASGGSSIAMGSNTTASGAYSTALGRSSFATSSNATAIGYGNVSEGVGSIAMGYQSHAGFAPSSEGNYTTAIGYQAAAYGDYSSAMGANTQALASYTTALGYNTTAGLSFGQGGDYATAIGNSTSATGNSSIAIGKSTTASGNYSTAMGFSSTADGLYSTAMGLSTNATNYVSTAIGHSTTASGQNSTAMGSNTTASGDFSTAMGGNTTASGTFSTAMGSYVSTNGRTGAFIIGDASTTAVRNALSNNSMTMRFAGGYRLYSNSSGASTGVYMSGGVSGWTNISDKNKKENFAEINGEKLLEKIKHLPITRWNYKNADPTIKYVGPMAQDFYKAFRLGGTDSLGINSIAIDGINLAAVKALEKRTSEQHERILIQNEKIKELEKHNLELRNQNILSKSKNSELEKRLVRIESIFKKHLISKN